MLQRYPLVFLLAGMTGALVIALLFLILTLNPPTEELLTLSTYMAVNGLVSVSLAYVIYRRGVARWFSSLHWSLLTSILLTTLLVVPIVWFTAQLMFISTHDFYLNLALLIFGGLTAVCFGLFIAHALTGRIEKLGQAAARLAAGKLDTRLEVTGKDELAQLAHSFNWMAQSLQEIDNQKRQVEQTRRDLIAWVSHDLRTPLTSMRVMLEAIYDEVVSDRETMMRYVKNSLVEIRNLNELINDLFELAQLDAGHPDMDFVQASLRDLISDVLSRMRARAESRRIMIKGEIHADIDPVMMAPDKMQRILVNLLDNAMRYTPPDGEVTVRAYRDSDRVMVAVHNTGSYIETKDAQHVFERFYRGEKSRSKSEDGRRGAGLGLAIVRGFIEAHRGEIQVESDPALGTTFRFWIPIVTRSNA